MDIGARTTHVSEAIKNTAIVGITNRKFKNLDFGLSANNMIVDPLNNMAIAVFAIIFG